MASVQMWDAAFDYVRLTYTDGGTYEDVAELYRKVAVSCVARATGGVIQERPWAALGYRGVNYGVVQVGTSPQGAILQATQWAAQAVRESNPPYTGVPRCDAQVTVWYDVDPGDLPKQYAQKSAAWSKAKGASGWQVTCIDGFGRGDTTYLGSRTSETYVRIYDKGRESQQPEAYANALRYEVEYKNRRAEAAWAGAHRTAPGRDALAALVRGTLKARGVYLGLPDSLVAPYTIPPEVHKDSVDRTLAWLAVQVRASLDKLQAQGVSSEHLRRLLGLTEDDAGNGPYRPV